MIDAARRTTNQHRTIKSIASTIALGLSALITPVSADINIEAKGIIETAVVRPSGRAVLSQNLTTTEPNKYDLTYHT